MLLEFLGFPRKEVGTRPRAISMEVSVPCAIGRNRAVNRYVNHEFRMCETMCGESIRDREMASSIYECISHFATREMTIVTAKEGVVVRGPEASPLGQLLHCNHYTIMSCVP